MLNLGVMNVLSLGNKLDCVIDHITDNILDIVGVTETWLSNDDKNNMTPIFRSFYRTDSSTTGGWNRWNILMCFFIIF